MRVYRNYWNGAAQVPEREEVSRLGGHHEFGSLRLGSAATTPSVSDSESLSLVAHDTSKSN